MNTEKNVQIELFTLPKTQSENEFNALWTDQNVAELRLKMLVIALEEINDGRKSASMKLEAWNWIFAEDDDSPFSAQVCAQCSGYNLDELQNLLRYVNRPSK